MRHSVTNCCRLGSPGCRFWHRDQHSGNLLGSVLGVNICRKEAMEECLAAGEVKLGFSHFQWQPQAFWSWDDPSELSLIETQGLGLIFPHCSVIVYRLPWEVVVSLGKVALFSLSPQRALLSKNFLLVAPLASREYIFSSEGGLITCGIFTVISNRYLEYLCNVTNQDVWFSFLGYKQFTPKWRWY